MQDEKSSFKRIFQKYIWAWLCPVLVVYIIIYGAAVIAIPVNIAAYSTESGFLSTVLQYLQHGVLSAAAFLYIYFTKKNRPILTAMGKKASGNTLRHALYGAAAGFALAGVCVLLAVLNHDIVMQFDRFEIFPLLILFASVLLQAAGEEILMRGYLFQRMRKAYKNQPVIAFAVVGLTFALLHMFNPGANIIAFLQIFLAGFIMSEMVYYFDSFWMACTFHTLWNYTQNIIFGIPVSGGVTAYSVFRVDTAAARDSFFYNTDFGLEASISSCVILLAGCIGIYLWGRKHQPHPIDVWE